MMNVTINRLDPNVPDPVESRRRAAGRVVRIAYAAIVFGVLGYLMKKTGFDPGPLVLAFVLGSLLETSLRRSLLLFDGNPAGFLTRPISGTLFVCFLAVILLPLARTMLRGRRAHQDRTREPV